MTPSRVTARIGVALCIVLAASIVSCTGGGRIPSVSSSLVTSATNPSGALQAVVTKQRSHGARSSDVTILYVLEAENTQYVDRDRILVLAGSGPVNVRWEAPIALCSVTVAEIGHGIYRADTHETRSRRRNFLDELKATVPIYPVTEITAEIIARIGGEQALKGSICRLVTSLSEPAHWSLAMRSAPVMCATLTAFPD